ncbi:ATP-binding protein [Desulfosporosinus sp. SYSU MS00001]|uniref:ATP-binding protein n=1 Tax=Desulfosporosinus sp. SYSU MS00001 TaxID=3416284 RepID=UPI003CEEACAB
MLNEGHRNLGFSTYDSARELIDDGIDSGAKKISLTIYQGDVLKNSWCWLYEDTGSGIRSSTLRDVFKFSKNLEPDILKNGKYHWGLTGAVLALAKRTDIYSKTIGDDWYYTYLDFTESSKGLTPQVYKCAPPLLTQDFDFTLRNEQEDSGTIIHIRDINEINMPGTYNFDGLLRELRNKLGETYGDDLVQGIEIYINGETAEAIDPLLLNEKARYVQEYGKSKEFCKFNIYFGEIEDHLKDKQFIDEIKEVYLNDISKHAITVRLVCLYHGNKAKLPVDLKPSIINSGFYIKRNKRLIGRAEKFIIGSHQKFTHFRAEITFSPVFDKFFAVQVNKSRYLVHDIIVNLINEKIIKLLKPYFGEKSSSAPSLIEKAINHYKLSPIETPTIIENQEDNKSFSFNKKKI